jgi:hypothetical protein
MLIKKECLSLAGEYAVASELCRKNLFAQITCGNHKKTDILVYKQDSKQFVQVEVKSTQRKTGWANCRGIKGSASILVCVDFSKAVDSNARPDFYILTEKDWLGLLESRYFKELHSEPDNSTRKLIIDEDNVPMWVNQKFKGADFKSTDIEKFKEAWFKLETILVET